MKQNDSDVENDESDSKNQCAETILRDFNYKLHCMFMEPSRNLKVT